MIPGEKKQRGRRWVNDDAILGSDLPHNVRHLLHVLNLRADAFSGEIPAQFQPSLKTLERGTGFRHETLLRLLTFAEDRGWLDRKRSRGGRGHRTHYRITPPQTGPDDGSIDTAETGPYTASFAASKTGPDPDRTGRENRSGSAAKTGPHAGPQLDQGARSGARSSIGAAAGDAANVIRRYTNATDDEITKLLEQPDVQNAGNPAAWCTTLGKNGDLRRRVDQLREHQDRAGDRQAVERWRETLPQLPACEHGLPGGDAPHPVNGAPTCPLCRLGTDAAG